MNNIAFLVALLMICTIACEEKDVLIELSQEIDEQSWYYEDTVRFNLSVENMKETYDLYLNMDHSRDYNRQNVYFHIVTVYPDGSRQEDVTNFNLANRGGAWYGKCSAKTCKVQAMLQSSFKFRDTGEYEFLITPHTRSNPLRGFTNLTLGLKYSGRTK